jgi:hypothetical protein
MSDLKISQELMSVLCDPIGNVCIIGSDEDRRVIKRCIDRIIKLEQPTGSVRAVNEIIMKVINIILEKCNAIQMPTLEGKGKLYNYALDIVKEIQELLEEAK